MYVIQRQVKWKTLDRNGCRTCTIKILLYFFQIEKNFFKVIDSRPEHFFILVIHDSVSFPFFSHVCFVTSIDGPIMLLGRDTDAVVAAGGGGAAGPIDGPIIRLTLVGLVDAVCGCSVGPLLGPI